MELTVTVAYIANGFIVTTTPAPPAGIEAEIYVTTLPEVVFWIDQIFTAAP